MADEVKTEKPARSPNAVGPLIIARNAFPTDLDEFRSGLGKLSKTCTFWKGEVASDQFRDILQPATVQNPDFEAFKFLTKKNGEIYYPLTVLNITFDEPLRPVMKYLYAMLHNSVCIAGMQAMKKEQSLREAQESEHYAYRIDLHFTHPQIAALQRDLQLAESRARRIERHLNKHDPNDPHSTQSRLDAKKTAKTDIDEIVDEITEKQKRLPEKLLALSARRDFQLQFQKDIRKLVRKTIYDSLGKEYNRVKAAQRSKDELNKVPNED